MKKGLIFVCALLVCFAFVAYAMPVNHAKSKVKESDNTTKTAVKPTATKAGALPGTFVSITGYADAWRATAAMYGKSIIASQNIDDPTTETIGILFGKVNGAADDLAFTFSFDGGASWDLQTMAASQNIRIYSGLALDPDGVPYVCWQDRDEWSIQWTKDEGLIGGGSWTAYDTLAGDSACWYIPSLAINNNGKIIMSAFAHALADPSGSDYSIHAVISNDYGSTWMAPFDRHWYVRTARDSIRSWNRWTDNTLLPGREEDDVDWAISPSGDTIVGFFDLIVDTIAYDESGDYSSFTPTYKISYDGGVTWSAIEIMGGGNPPTYTWGGWWYMYDAAWIGDRPYFIFGHQDCLWNGGAVYEYHPTVAGDYSNWTINRVSDIPLDPMGSNGFSIDCPSVSSDEAGNLFVVYKEYEDVSATDAYAEIYGVASTDGGNTWLTPVALSSAEGLLDGDPYIEQAEKAINGKVHILYHTPSYDSLMYFAPATSLMLTSPARSEELSLAPMLTGYADTMLYWAPPGFTDSIAFSGVGGPIDGTVDVMTSDSLYFLWSNTIAWGGLYELTISKTSDWSGTEVYQFTDSYIDYNAAQRKPNPISYIYDNLGVVGVPSTGVWYWKVRAHKGSESSPWSEIYDFDYQGSSINTTDWVPKGVAGNPVNVTHPFVLSQSRPNPARDNAAISFSLPKAGAYSLKVYNVAGQVVRTINGTGTAGMNTVNVNSRNLSNGVYFYQLTANNNTATKKMVVLK